MLIIPILLRTVQVAAYGREDGITHAEAVPMLFLSLDSCKCILALTTET